VIRSSTRIMTEYGTVERMRLNNAEANLAVMFSLFPRAIQCSFTCGSVRRVMERAMVSSATLNGPCSAVSCIL
jgi:hypothetical protein